MSVTHSQTKTTVVNEALKDWVRLRKLQQLRELRGRLNWEGNLRELRKLEQVHALHPPQLSKRMGETKSSFPQKFQVHKATCRDLFSNNF